MSINKVFLICNITRDPEKRKAGETPLIQFGIAVNEYRKEGGHATETALLVLAAVLVIVSFIGLIYMFVKKKSGVDLPVKLFFALILLTVLVSYYLFCFQFPYVCTENIRYCIPIIPILAMGFGFLVNAAGNKLKSQ